MRGLLLLLLLAITVAILVSPMLILHPFKAETAQGISITYAVKRWGLLADLLLLAAAIALAARMRRRVLAGIAIVLMVAATALARVNMFERMFRPLPDARYATVAATNFVDADDMVMTVAHGNDAAAYPIRQMGYHHIVQDVVGGLPIVVTY